MAVCAMVRLLVPLMLVGCEFRHGMLPGGDGGGSDSSDGREADASVDAAAPARRCTLLLGSDHTCSIRHSDRTLWCVGDNDLGELGTGTTSAYSVTPLQLGFGAVVAAATRSYHTCASLVNGSVGCWGYNDGGQVGDGSSGTTPRPTPAAVASLTDVNQLALGRMFSCAKRTNGSVTCWGQNTSYQLGDGTMTQQLTPATTVMGLKAVPIALFAGGSHVCALLPGRVGQCWGSNSYGQLGDGTQTTSATPIDMPVTGIAQIATSSYFVSPYTGGQTCAVAQAGTISCWGSRDFGQLGNGEVSATPSLVPVSVQGITTAVEITMGRYHVCARDMAGVVSCWGRNDGGQIGDGTYNIRSTPYAVTLPRPAVHIGAGGHHSCALLDDDSVYCWGFNTNGQLADTSLTTRTMPVASSACP